MIENALKELNLGTAWDLLQPALVFAVVLGIYAATVFYLCRFMSKKDIIRVKYTVLRRLTGQSFVLTSLLLIWIFVFRYGVIFPVVAYGWFGTLTVMVAFMYNTKEPAQLILISMSVVTAVRVTAYFSEDLSRDIARILPFALLGLFIANFGEFEIGVTARLLRRILTEWDRFLYYWAFIVAQELTLRTVSPTLIVAGHAMGRTVRRARDERWWRVWQFAGRLRTPGRSYIQ